MDKKIRSITKAVSWRIMATVTTMAIVFLLTGELALAFGVGIIEVLAKLLLFYIHERIWENVSWGREPVAN